MSDIVGINRQDDVENWIECLLSLHKKRNFDLFSDKSTFEKFLTTVKNDDNDLPHVIEEGGKDFVAGNGKHRITFAKCLGIKTIIARVSKKIK